MLTIPPPNLNKQVAQFKGFTGSDDASAQFYLDSFSWSLEPAVKAFYDVSLFSLERDLFSLERETRHEARSADFTAHSLFAHRDTLQAQNK